MKKIFSSNRSSTPLSASLQSVSLQTRLLLTSIFLVLIPALITTLTSTYISSRGLTTDSFDQL